MKTVVLIGALPESLTNFRGKLLERLVSAGFHVHAMAAPAAEDQVLKLKAIGVNYVAFPVQRTGLNPLKDVETYRILRRELKKINPDIVLAYTIKPVIWGGLATRGVKDTKFFALVTGLGFAFQSAGLLRQLLAIIVSSLYKGALAKASGVIFQNADDRDLFVARRIVDAERCHIVNGSGVDTQRFQPNEKSPDKNRPVFLTIARLLEEKGLRVYMEAARIVRKSYPHAVFRLLGQPDPSPGAIEIEEVLRWKAEGLVEYLGDTHDVRPFLAECDVFVLASFYGEGLPRTILEAMAMAKPILTTDNVGCRETVDVGQNGFLVPIKSPALLAEKMIWFIEHLDQCEEMGKASRKLAVERFDVEKVNAEMLRIMGVSDDV